MIDKIMFVTMAHIRPETAGLLKARAVQGVRVYPKIEDGEVAGYFVYVDGAEDGDNFMPDDLRCLLYYASVAGCRVVSIDQDGPKVSGLLTYEW